MESKKTEYLNEARIPLTSLARDLRDAVERRELIELFLKRSSQPEYLQLLLA